MQIKENSILYLFLLILSLLHNIRDIDTSLFYPIKNLVVNITKMRINKNVYQWLDLSRKAWLCQVKMILALRKLQKPWCFIFVVLEAQFGVGMILIEIIWNECKNERT